jgi:hypothetical protein
MFSKGSRYRNLAESSALTAEGERLRGKDLRLIPRRAGRFQHIVREGDRLDLLAFKYYGDPSKWWQIADANSEFGFPTDLLDRRPAMEERLKLTHRDFIARIEELRKALGAFGEVRVGELGFFDDETRPRDPDFLESTVVVIYTPSPTTHSQIVSEINKRFHLLGAFAWSQADKTAEAFTFDDRQVKSQWQAMTSSLIGKPGMSSVRSVIAEATLQVVYHGGRLSREEILTVITANGFSVEAAQLSEVLRTGAKIVIPPNQIGG